MGKYIEIKHIKLLSHDMSSDSSHVLLHYSDHTIVYFHWYLMCQGYVVAVIGMATGHSHWLINSITWHWPTAEFCFSREFPLPVMNLFAYCKSDVKSQINLWAFHRRCLISYVTCVIDNHVLLFCFKNVCSSRSCFKHGCLSIALLVICFFFLPCKIVRATVF